MLDRVVMDIPEIMDTATDIVENGVEEALEMSDSDQRLMVIFCCTLVIL